jgi:hypothetical protein
MLLQPTYADVQGEFAMIIVTAVPKLNSLKLRKSCEDEAPLVLYLGTNWCLAPSVPETNLITLRIGTRVDPVTFLNEFTKTVSSDCRRDFHLFGLSLTIQFPHKTVTTEVKVMMIMMMIMMMIIIIIIM